MAGPSRRQTSGRLEAVDSSVLIPHLRFGDHAAHLRDLIDKGRLLLPALVALELYAGTRTQDEKRVLDAIVRGFSDRGNLLVATGADHVTAGILMSRRRRLTGDLRARDHLVDALIVVNAARVGADVLSNNVAHMEAWAALLPRGLSRVRVRAPAD